MKTGKEYAEQLAAHDRHEAQQARLRRIEKAAEEVIASAQRERHGLSSVADAVLNDLADALREET